MFLLLTRHGNWVTDPECPLLIGTWAHLSSLKPISDQSGTISYISPSEFGKEGLMVTWWDWGIPENNAKLLRGLTFFWGAGGKRAEDR